MLVNVHCFEWRERVRMCSKHIFTALLVFSLSSVMADPPAPDPENTAKCLQLNNITEVAEKDSTYLADVLIACKTADRTNLTWEAGAVFDIFATVGLEDYEHIKNFIITSSAKIEECINKATSKKFLVTESQKKFGFKDTRALSFDYDRCENSNKLWECIQNLLYVNGTLTAEAKAQKDILEKAFNVTSEVCEKMHIREDRSSSQNLDSSVAVILSSAIMMIKLHISDF